MSSDRAAAALLLESIVLFPWHSNDYYENILYYFCPFAFGGVLKNVFFYFINCPSFYDKTLKDIIIQHR